jgi:hypothetical protein
MLQKLLPIAAALSILAASPALADTKNADKNRSQAEKRLSDHRNEIRRNWAPKIANPQPNPKLPGAVNSLSMGKK